jgi:hypothetical protein
MNVFERRNYPVTSLLKYLSYYITKQRAWRVHKLSFIERQKEFSLKINYIILHIAVNAIIL